MHVCLKHKHIFFIISRWARVLTISLFNFIMHVYIRYSSIKKTMKKNNVKQTWKEILKFHIL